jgi:ATP-dependent DNA ligase
MIKQCKGKDIEKVPKSKLLQDGWYASIKYDGHYVQIHKKGNNVTFFTSGGKEFYIEHIADELCNLNPNVDFIIECEYIADTTGKLGCRGSAAKLTTYRTNFAKGLESGSIVGKDIFKVFDLIYYDNSIIGCNWIPEHNIKFDRRLSDLKSIELGTHCELVITPYKAFNLDKIDVNSFLDEGYEGLYLKHKDHIYEPGKRVNTAIKLKGRKTADLLCLGMEPGEGKYEGMIGSLILIDTKGRVVRVGSGLNDSDRLMAFDLTFKDRVIEIEYEQILDTYIQPTYIRVRDDKTKEEID